MRHYINLSFVVVSPPFVISVDTELLLLLFYIILLRVSLSSVHFARAEAFAFLFV